MSEIGRSMPRRRCCSRWRLALDSISVGRLGVHQLLQRHRGDGGLRRRRCRHLFECERHGLGNKLAPRVTNGSSRHDRRQDLLAGGKYAGQRGGQRRIPAGVQIDQARSILGTMFRSSASSFSSRFASSSRSAARQHPARVGGMIMVGRSPGYDHRLELVLTPGQPDARDDDLGRAPAFSPVARRQPSAPRPAEPASDERCRETCQVRHGITASVNTSSVGSSRVLRSMRGRRRRKTPG